MASPLRPVDRFVCIHGHFYQPPRENPWLETIPLQPSAAPFKNWNERIDAECFGPNAESLILSDGERVSQVLNNYSHISFNFGPTLLSWLEEFSPETYQAILRADCESAERFSGHGSALAQAYNHTILPLALRRDKEIQVAWGIQDFKRHFGRDPEGMWLPETAVDVETLEVLADFGIQFTILAPRQAAPILKAESSQEAPPDTPLNTRHPYWCRLPSGRRIALFFYDGALSQAVAFEGLLLDGLQLAKRLLSGFSAEPETAELSHIATDGETYGHHHRYGEMALAFALESLKANPSVQLTNYGEFLERFPPEEEIGIVEGSSWSCVHGIGRWREDCGCRTGYNPNWNQQWRKGLRDALNHLAGRCNELFQERAGNLLANPEGAVGRYVEVLPNRDPRTRDAFLDQELVPNVGAPQRVTALRLLEMRRQCQLIFTSCAWFFDEISGIEPVQILNYAARAIELAGLLGEEIEEDFLEMLSKAESNLPEHGNARDIYRELVLPNALSPLQVSAHAAFLTLFELDSEAFLPAYRIHFSNLMRSTEDRVRRCIGEVEIEEIRTAACWRFSFYSAFQASSVFRALIREEEEDSQAGGYRWLFEEGPLDVRRWEEVSRQPGDHAVDFESLRHEVQAAIMERLGDRVRRDKLVRFETFLNDNQELFQWFGKTRLPLPAPLPAVVESVLREEVPALIHQGGVALLRQRMNQAHRWGVDFTLDGWHALLRRQLGLLAGSREKSLEERLKQLLEGLELATELQIPMDRSSLQRWFYHQTQELAENPEQADPGLKPLLESLSTALSVELPESLRK